jgi:hypothetical protein
MKSIIRTVIIVAIVGAIGYFGYTYFISDKSQSTSGGLETTAGFGSGNELPAGTSPSLENLDLGTDFLVTLLSVQSIKLDDRIFEDPAFKSLQDFNRPLLPDTDPGRPNPFAPIGTDSSGLSTQISTSNTSDVKGSTSVLNGTLNEGGEGVTRWFAYGTTSSLGMTTTPKPQLTPGAFAETISDLTPNTVYYAKAMATIAGQTLSGNLVTWRTAQTTATPATPAKKKTN